MLYLAALMFILVGLMHSVLGGRYLINPILRMPGLPVILGRPEYTRRTLWAGWHLLSVFWWVIAASLIVLAARPAVFTPSFLGLMALTCAVCGVIAILASRGRHFSWIFFFGVAGALATVLGQGGV